MVFRNYDEHPEKRQNHTAAAVIGTIMFIVVMSILFSSMFAPDIPILWKVLMAALCIWILYGVMSMTKKSLVGKDYCSECGRLYDEK